MAVADEPEVLRLGTRGSLLARTQSGLVADALRARFPNLRVDFTVFKTSGDRIVDRPLHEFGGKGLFTKELEEALLAGAVDFVVHSFKDVPVTMPLVEQSGLVVGAVPERADPRDVLVSRTGLKRIEDLPNGALVGTGSLRRRCQILALRPDVRVEAIRGNIDTRLGKLRRGEFDAVVLAMAGVIRAGLFDPAEMHPLAEDELLPAPGQAALALQCRRDDALTRALLAALHHPATAACVAAERGLVEALRGDCLSPIAARATEHPGGIRLRAAVGGRGGAPPVLRAAVDALDPAAASAAAFEALARQDVMRLLHG